MNVSKYSFADCSVWSQNCLHIDLLLLPGRLKPVLKKRKQNQTKTATTNQPKTREKEKQTQAKTMKRNQISNVQEKDIKFQLKMQLLISLKL